MGAAHRDAGRRALTLTLAAAIAGCPVFPDDRCLRGPCVVPDSLDDGGPSAPPPDGAAPTDGGLARDDDPSLAVHVAPQGSDATGSGSRESPFRTIARALATAQGEDVSLHLCAARFEEAVAIAEPGRRVAITGGFACPGSATPWAVGSGETQVVATSAHRFDLRALRVRGVRFDARDATRADAPSSIAVDVRTLDGAEFARCVLVAGKGLAGAEGVSSAVAAASGLDGRAGTGTTGGGAPERTCGPGVFTRGGSGGSGIGSTTRGASGATSRELAGNAGVSGDEAAPRNCSAGGVGPDGSTRPLVGDASDALDTSTGKAADGRAGSDGDPGQGGGGGGTASARDGAPSGASGGCGGAGGAGGGGGGSSIALVVHAGAVTLTDTELRSGAAGAGGAGAKGGDGAAGGHGIRLGESTTAGPCSSGDGGYGAGGEGGEGGHGGAVVGALVVGNGAFFLDGTLIAASRESAPSISLGTAGAGGAAGAGGRGGPSFVVVAGRVGKEGLRQAIRFVTVR